MTHRVFASAHPLPLGLPIFPHPTVVYSIHTRPGLISLQPQPRVKASTLVSSVQVRSQLLHWYQTRSSHTNTGNSRCIIHWRLTNKQEPARYPTAAKPPM